MPECIQCGGYTKFSGGLCYKCYKDRNGNVEIDVEESDAAGLSDKEFNYRYSMIKGRIAETLIQGQHKIAGNEKTVYISNKHIQDNFGQYKNNIQSLQAFLITN